MILTESRLAYYFDLYMQRESKIWKDLQDRLYQKYLDQGYSMWFAEVKAEREVLELRSLPRKEEI